MALNVMKLQAIVDKIAVPVMDRWELKNEYADEFFSYIDGYVKKAAFKSDRFDPEDAYADVQWEVWKALERYGPRPKGQLFGNYTLKLKVNNVLTNRARKRDSIKSRLNYMSQSLDVYNDWFIDRKPISIPVEGLSEEQIFPVKKLNLRELSMSDILSIVQNLPTNEKKQLFCNLVGTTIGVEGEELENFYTKFFDFMPIFIKIGKALYNNNDGFNKAKEDLVMSDQHKFLRRNVLSDGSEYVPVKNDLSKVKIGDKFVSHGGKVIEIKGKTVDGFKVEILIINKETTVTNNYIENEVTPYEDLTKPLRVSASTRLEEAKEDASEDIPDDAPDAEATDDSMPGMNIPDFEIIKVPTEEFIGHSPKLIKHKEPAMLEVNPEKEVNVAEVSISEKGKKKMAREGTAKALVISLLKEGPQTRDSLAKAIVAKGLGKNKDVAKVKNYASVILSLLKIKDGLPIQPVEGKRGTYILAEPTETTEGATTTETA